MTSWLGYVCLLIVCAVTSRGDQQQQRSLSQSQLEMIRGILDGADAGDVSVQQKPDYNQILAEVRDVLLEISAKHWLQDYNADMLKHLQATTLAEFTYSTNITDHNEREYSNAEAAYKLWQSQQIQKARDFNESSDAFVDDDVRRMLKLILLSNDASTDEAANRKRQDLSNSMESAYSSAKPGGQPLSYYVDVMAHSRNWTELTDAWMTWRDATGKQIRETFTEYVELANAIVQQIGWTDVGQTWRLQDFEEDAIEHTVDRLYYGILPLYKQLHAYVRRKLIEQYDGEDIAADGSIPAHILGNMWAQSWGNIFDIVKPFPHCADAHMDSALTKYSPKEMFELAEEFFTSLGLEPMTDTFWRRSLIERPEDRDVVCHAAAEDLFTQDDFRIKMCTEVTHEHLLTIHHEMGHIEYFMQYANQPTLYRSGANAAFHEAIGDTIGLSVSTPEHLRTAGLLDDVTDDHSCTSGEVTASDLNFLMGVALKKIAFLPYGYLLDKYRFEVFRGNIDDSDYNAAWWAMSELLRGIKAPVARSEDDFDPGAKYHVTSNVPYMRYFLAHLAQFQFLEAMCDVAGHTGPLHKCDVYNSREAGDLLKLMLSLGRSKPWPVAMRVMTGQPDFKTDSLFKYFKPLHDWLVVQNAQEHLGWS